MSGAAGEATSLGPRMRKTIPGRAEDVWTWFSEKQEDQECWGKPAGALGLYLRCAVCWLLRDKSITQVGAGSGWLGRQVARLVTWASVAGVTKSWQTPRERETVCMAEGDGADRLGRGFWVGSKGRVWL